MPNWAGRVCILAGSGGLLVSGGCPASADEVQLTAVADTTLVELAPDNNLGGQPFCNAGTAGVMGPARNRSLYRFDVGLRLPAGSRVLSAVVVFEVTQEPAADGMPSVFRLHRVLRSWGEGVKQASVSPGLGLPATAGEATWNHRQAGTTNTWSVAGGQAGVDFLEVPSAEAQVYGVDDTPYAFGPAAALAADVQAWLDDPASDHGWMLMTAAETTAKTARRFGSRESAGEGARLIVTFDPPPRIDWITCATRVELGFRARAGRTYRIDYSGQLANGGPWELLSLVPPPATDTNVVVTDGPVVTAFRFYRLVLLPP